MKLETGSLQVYSSQVTLPISLQIFLRAEWLIVFLMALWLHISV